MASEKHRAILMKKGVKAWNVWRSKPEGFLREPDLSGTNLGGADLGGADQGQAQK
jgi:hypothetical protein